MFKSLLPWKHVKTKVVQTMEDEEHLQGQRLSPCSTCGRTFLPLPLKKHAPICEKNASKRRRVFDSLKQRIEGTDLEQFHQKTYLKKQDSAPKVEKRKPRRWEEDHLKLVDAIRSAKGASRAMTPAKKPSVVALVTPSERCPFCERNFGPKAFDRHVEWCKQQKTRLQKSPANVLLAKERLEARTKYKVPPLNKPKRLAVKQKYALLNRTESICSVKSTPSRKPAVVKTATKMEKSKSDDLKKAKEQPKSHNYDPFASAERQFKELLESADFKTLRPQTSVEKSTTKPSSQKANKRASVIEPPVSFQDEQDEFEMLENLINRQLLEEKKLKKNDFNVLERKYSDDVSSIDSNLINENDNLAIPEHFQLDDYSPTSDSTIRNDTDFYSLNFDKDVEGEGKKSAKSKNKLNCSKKNGAVRPKTERKVEKSSKKAVEAEEEEIIDLTVKPEDLFAVDDKMYAEYKIYEEMYLKEKDLTSSKRQKSRNNLKSYGIDIMGEELNNFVKKVSNDSAYGSLNRNTPQPSTAKLSPIQRKRIDSDSSGSELALSPLFGERKMSKFCHECGSRYPLATAKFCVECGVRRLCL